MKPAMDGWFVCELLLWLVLILLLIWLVLAPCYWPKWGVWNESCGRCDVFVPSQSQFNLVSNMQGMAREYNASVQGSWGLCLDSYGTSLWSTQLGSGLLLNLSLSGCQIGGAITVPFGTGTVGPRGFPCGVATWQPAEEPRCDRCKHRKKMCRQCVAAAQERANSTSANTSGQPPFFSMSSVGQPAPCEVIVSTEDGVIAGYNSNANASQMLVLVDQSANDVIYKGCVWVGDSFYVCNFSAGRVDVYDSTWSLVNSFTDPSVSIGSVQYVPYAITYDRESQRLFVSFVQPRTSPPTDAFVEAGAGNGYISVFSLDGTLARRLVTRGYLNAPSGLAVRGKYIYVSNFGDGSIVVYQKCTGSHVGTFMSRSAILPRSIEGVQSILFVPNAKQSKACCRKSALAFASSPDDGNIGLVGRLVNRT